MNVIYKSAVKIVLVLLQYRFSYFEISELNYFEKLVFSEIMSYKAINDTVQTIE